MTGDYRQISGIKKIVLFGSESTGKTTLAQQLAAHYKTVWVPEYSRMYQEKKGASLDITDVIPVAKGQIRLEEKALPYAHKLLICDTDILETKVYSEAYNGACPQWLLDIIPQRRAHFYLLTHIDLPWEPDGIRDRPDNREQMHAFFKNELLSSKQPFVEIAGNYQQRLQQAISAIDSFLDKSRIEHLEN